MADLLEREEDLTRLAAHVDGLIAGAGAVVVIEGPAGIGKSVLMDAATRRAAERGAAVLSARGTELELDLAFGAVRQLFSMAVGRLQAEDRERVLAGPAVLARPALGLEPAIGRHGGLSDPLHGLFWLVANLAELQPLVLTVDDLHWLDEESARFVTYLAQRIADLPALLLATARPVEPGANPGPAAALGQIADVVRPSALSPAAVSVLLGDHRAEAAHRATGGNPLLVVELGRALADAAPSASIEDIAPASVGRAVLARVARISHDAVALARAVSLAPGALPLADSAELAELDLERAATAADALVSAQVLAADTNELTFLHPMMRAAVYEELGTFARARGHARAAALLTRRGAPAEAIAAHLLAGKPEADPANVEILSDAADAALSGNAPRAAVRYLERALAEPPAPGPDRAVLRRRLGRLQAALGRPEAAAVLTDALGETTEPAARADIAAEIGQVLMLAGQPDRAIEVLQRALGEGELDARHQLAIDGILAQAAWDGAAPELFSEVVRRLPPDVSGETPAERMALVTLAYDRFCRLEHVSTVAEPMLRAVAAMTEYDVTGDLSMRLINVLLQLCGEFDAARDLAEEWLAVARETGAESAYGAAQSVLGDLAWLRGELRTAEAVFRLGLQAPGTLGYDRRHQLMNLTEVLLTQGRVDDAAEQASMLPPADEAGAIAAHTRRTHALITLARGDAAAALPAFEAVGAELHARNSVNPAEQIWRFDHALALHGCDRADEGVAMMTSYLADARRFGEPLPIGIGHLALGLLRGDRRELEQADEVLRDSHYRWWAARAALELGAAMRREHDTVASREPLRRALDYAERHGAAPIASRAREELKLAGVRPGAGLLSGVAALTPSEERIARLGAEGMTNKEIAQHLFLTVKTVESHLASVFRKLDVKSRRQLTDALAEPVASAT